MKEHPILMSGDNPKLILQGRKTQTRRIVADKRLSPKLTLIELFDFLGGGGACEGTGSHSDDEGLRVSFVSDIERQDDSGRRYKYTGLLVQSECVPEDGAEDISCPLGVAGDRLWVRETHYRWGKWSRGKWRFRDDALGLERDGGLVAAKSKTEEGWHKRPSILFPRLLADTPSAIWLEILKVRVERLNDISEADARAEGMSPEPPIDMIGTYAKLWDKLHGENAWQINPWVWVLEFRKMSGSK